jgi:hypothetical protein
MLDTYQGVGSTLYNGELLLQAWLVLTAMNFTEILMGLDQAMA